MPCKKKTSFANSDGNRIRLLTKLQSNTNHNDTTLRKNLTEVQNKDSFDNSERKPMSSGIINLYSKTFLK